MVKKTKNKMNEAIGLFEKGLMQKEIAKKLGVTEKTIGNWLKPYKELHENKMESLKNLNVRLQELTKNPETSIDEIERVNQLIKDLQNRKF